MTQLRLSLRCGKCKGPHNQVTRTMKRPHSIVRYRKCKTCGHNLKTIEIHMEHLSTDPKFDFLFRKATSQ